MLVHGTRDFFLLFAEAQRAFGTRVFFDVSYLSNAVAVLIVSPVEFCVMSECDSTLLLRVQLRDVSHVTVVDGQCCNVTVSDKVVHAVAVHASPAAAAVCDALSRREAPALDWNNLSREDSIAELNIHWFPLLTADWAARVRTALAKYPLFGVAAFTVRIIQSSSFSSQLTPCLFSVR